MTKVAAKLQPLSKATYNEILKGINSSDSSRLMFYSNAHKGTHTSIHSQEFHLSKTLLHLLISYRFASIQTAGVFSTSSETRRSAIKIYTTILHEPTGYKEGVGGEFEENVKVNR